ncbi:MAG: hypothetical protein HY951_10150 [Bacteroidia bacterium]|nr:hypothetical protein [Bacteroidia bacterium]
MRIVFFILVISCISTSLFSQSKKEKKAIKTWGIKSVTEMVVEVVNEKEATRKDSYTTYDKNANIIYNEEFRKDGTLKHKESNKYDSKGNLLEEIVFDAADNKTEKNYKKTYKYDSEENKTEESEFDETGKLVKKIIFSYNANGDKTGEAEYNGAGKIAKKSVYAYDSKGLKAVKKEFDANNQVISTRTYKYDF